MAMDQPIHINTNFGKIAYEAWVSEFCDYPWDEWDEISKINQEAWEDIAFQIIENRVVLPPDGVEISFRTATGTTVFAFCGAATPEMKSDIIDMVWMSMSGQIND